MTELLIGTLRLQPFPSPEDRQPGGEERPEDVWLPQLFVAGLPFPRFASAMIARAQAAGRTWPEGATPRPEGGYFQLHPDAPLNRAAQPLVVACCSCGMPGCGSNSARVHATELGGVPGLHLSGWHTRETPERALPVGSVFIPIEAWPAPLRGSSVRELLDAPAEARATWAHQQPWMLAAARAAGAALPDPWGRALEIRHWDRVARTQERQRAATRRAEAAWNRSPAGIQAALHATFDRLDALERRVRAEQGADMDAQLASLATQRAQAWQAAERDTHLAGLSRQGRRVARRAALREQFSADTQAQARAARDAELSSARARLRAALGI